MSNWRDYEEQIYAMLEAKAEPGAVIVFDAQRPGGLSGIDRQIDVWLEGTLAGGVVPGPVSLAVDCKCWNSKVNVPEVERFLGTLEDVGADIGLLVTTTGFSSAAQTRANRSRGLQLEVLTFEQLAEWGPSVEVCLVCNDDGPESDAPPGMFYVERLEDHPGFFVGSCDRCQAVHIRCACGVLNGIYEGQEGEEIECEGCGQPFVVDRVEFDSNAIPVNDAPKARVQIRAQPPI
jgi:hypothetical protein